MPRTSRKSRAVAPTPPPTQKRPTRSIDDVRTEEYANIFTPEDLLRYDPRFVPIDTPDDVAASEHAWYLGRLQEIGTIESWTLGMHGEFLAIRITRDKATEDILAVGALTPEDRDAMSLTKAALEMFLQEERAKLGMGPPL